MKEIIELINQMSPFLLLGFLLAGAMHAFIPSNMYGRYLGGSSFRSVINAAILGIPLPLCSCGTIPTAMSLRKEGASKGATVSFMIATPQTGIDSIIATYSVLGLPFALIRPIAAFITSLCGGQLVNILDKKEEVRVQKESKPEEGTKRTLIQKLAMMLRYAYVEMMQDIGRWLIIGLLTAGLITVLVPDSFFELFNDNSLLSMLIVLVFAIPMYLCATGSIPIAAALMLKGMSPGSALVLLMAGPAINAASMLVAGKILGKRTLAIYILSITLGAIIFGLGIDYLLPRVWFISPIGQMSECCNESSVWINTACSIILVLLLINAMILRFRHKKQSCSSTIRYRIEGLKCNHCKANAEKAIASIEGIEKVEIDLSTGTAVITGIIDEDAIKDAVEALGFKLHIS